MNNATSFNNGLITGMSMGLSIEAKNSSDSPKCWNDKATYTYFYISFPKSLMPFSQGQFTSSIKTTPDVGITGVEQINSDTIKVYCTLPKQGSVTVYSLAPVYLNYSNRPIYPFSSNLSIDGSVSVQKWIFESFTSQTAKQTEWVAVVFPAAYSLVLSEQMQTKYTAMQETVTILFS